MAWRDACLPPDGVAGGNSPGGRQGGNGKAARGVTAGPMAGAALAYRILLNVKKEWTYLND